MVIRREASVLRGRVHNPKGHRGWRGRTPLAYPVYSLDYEEDRQRFERGTGIEGLFSVGRNGEFRHILMEDVYWRTRFALRTLIDRSPVAVARNDLALMVSSPRPVNPRADFQHPLTP